VDSPDPEDSSSYQLEAHTTGPTGQRSINGISDRPSREPKPPQEALLRAPVWLTARHCKEPEPLQDTLIRAPEQWIAKNTAKEISGLEEFKLRRHRLTAYKSFKLLDL
jgi:hypothetical protein